MFFIDYNVVVSPIIYNFENRALFTCSYTVKKTRVCRRTIDDFYITIMHLATHRFLFVTFLLPKKQLLIKEQSFTIIKQIKATSLEELKLIIEAHSRRIRKNFGISVFPKKILLTGLKLIFF